jgi:hypothetical protein
MAATSEIQLIGAVGTRRGEPTPQRPRRQDNEPRRGMPEPLYHLPETDDEAGLVAWRAKGQQWAGQAQRLVLDLAHPDLEKAEHRRPSGGCKQRARYRKQRRRRDKQIPTQRRAAKTQNDGDDSRGRNERCAPRCHQGSDA